MENLLNMKKLIFILFTLCSVAAFGQVPSLNDAVRNNTLSPARVANALDASKAFEALGTDTYTTSILTGVYTAYTSGDVFKITFTNANTGAATLNINSLGAIAIRDNSGTALAADAIVAGGTYILRYNGTHFRIVGATGSGGGGGIELQTKTETGTTYTVTDADHFYRINFTNASGCDVTFGDGVTAGTYVVLRRVSGAGDIQAVAGGTGVLNAYNDDYTIEVEDGEAAWFKRDGTNWDGSGYLGASGAATWGNISGTLSSQTDLQTALDAKAPLASPTFTGTPAAPTASTGTNTTQVATTAFVQQEIDARSETLTVAFSDEVTPVTATTSKVCFHWQYSSTTVTGMWVGLSTAQTSGSIFTVDVNKAGATMLSTKITVDNGDETSRTAVTAPVLSTTALTVGDKVCIDVDQVGDGTAKGGKLYIEYTRP